MRIIRLEHTKLIMKNLITILFVFISLFTFSQELSELESNLSNSITYDDKIENVKKILDLAYSKKDIDLGYEYFELGLELAQSNKGNEKDEVSVLNKFADLQSDLGLYDKAVELYMKSQEILKDMGDADREKHDLFISLSITFQHKGDFVKALDYANYSLDISKNMEDDALICSSLRFLSNVYLEIDELDLALENYYLALDKSNNIGDKKVSAQILNNIGLVYQNKENYDNAEKYFFKAYNLAKEVEYFLLIAYIESELSDFYTLTEDYEKAEKYLTLSLEKEREANYIILSQNLFENAHDLYKKTGDYKKSLEFFEKYQVISDSLNKQGNDQKILEAETKFRTNEKEKEIKILNTENLLKESEIKKRNIAIFLTAIISISVLFMLFLVHRSRKKQIKLTKEITHQKEEITDSINYAKIIQDSIFGKKETITDVYEKSSILFKPKDIVSGDFYWFHKNEDKFLFTAADCTGHGVPGAMMSMIGNNSLNDSVKVKGMTKPSEILNHLSQYVYDAFADNDTKNGMDIAFCSLDIKTKELEYSGAFNSLYVFKKNGELVEIKSDKKYIGDIDSEYTNHKLQLDEGDCIYIMSDGYVDQFGGEKNKKYKTANLKREIKKVVDQPVEVQKDILEKNFDAWMGDSEQVDDVCLVIVRV